MTEELEQLLKNLKLRRMLEIYDEQLRSADKDDISYSEFVTRLVRAQFQRVCGAGVHRQGGKYRPGRGNRKRQDRIGVWSAAEGAGEWLPLSVRQGPGLVRRDVRLAGGSFLAAVAQAPGPSGRPFDRRNLGI